MIRVLLVDDEPALCEITKIFLEREGDISVAPSLSAEEALERIETECFDVVVSDYEMPGMSGIDLLKALNALGLSIPVIIFTGRGREEVVIDALNNGAEYYLQKGGDPRLQFAELRYMILKAARNRLTEQTLADREAEYKELFERMLNGFALHELILDSDGTPADYRFLEVNPAYEEITGLKADDIIGKTVLTVLPDLEPEWIDDCGRVALSGTPEHIERYARSFGKWFEVAAFSPRKGFFVTIIADITERKETEDRLKNRISALTRPTADLEDIGLADIIDVGVISSLQNQVSSLAGVASIIFDRDGAPIIKDSRVTEFCSVVRSSSQYQAAPPYRLLQQGHKEPVICRDFCFDGLMYAIVPIIVEGRLLAQWVLCPALSGEPDFEQVEKFARSIGIDETACCRAVENLPYLEEKDYVCSARFIEILASQISALGIQNLRQARLLHELNAVESALQEEEELSEILLSTVPAGIYLKDTDGRYLSVNNAFEDIFGVSSNAITGKNDYDVLESSCAALFAKDDQTVLETGKQKVTFEQEITTADGRHLWITTSRTPRYSGSGSVTGVVGIVLDVTEQKKANETVAANEIRYREFFNNMGSGMAVFEDRDGRFIICDINLALERMIGVAQSDAVGRDVAEIMPASLYPGVLGAVIRVQNSGKPEQIPISREEDGALVFWWELSVYCLPSGEIVAVVDDRTAEKRAGAALERSEQEYRTVIENLQDVFFRADFSGRLELISPSGAALFGFTSAGDLEGTNFVDAAFPERCIWDQMVAEVRDKGAVTGWEFTLRRRDGSTVPVSVNVHLWIDSSGGVPGIEGMIRDITWNKKAEEKLRSSKELLEGVLDGINDTVGVLKPDFTVVRYNRAGYELMNCTPKDAGKKCYELLGRSTPCEVCATGAALKSRKIEEIERFFPELGRYMVCRSNPIIGEDGDVHLVIEQIADISERRRMEMALQQANKKLNILNSITRHDILNWMTALLGYLEIEKETVSDPSLLTIIEKEEIAAFNIKRLITFTKDYQDIGVYAPVWQGVERIVRSAIRHQDLTGVKAEVFSGDVEVYADPMFIRVIENLIDNSLRHGGHVTAIRFTMEKNGSDAMFIYEDNGIGIPEPEKSLIFKQGYGKNTGFGLFLSKEILSITGLAITEEGEYGRGVRFGITIPPVAYRSSGSEPEM